MDGHRAGRSACNGGGGVMGDVRALPGVSAPDRPRNEQPVEQVITALEHLLAEAKAGTIRAVAYAIVNSGERTAYGWAQGHGQTAHEQTAAISDLAFAWSMNRYKTTHDA